MSEERPVALVTGASRGIGRGIALKLASVGYAIAVNYVRNRDAAEDVADTIRAGGGSAIVIQADISSSEDHQRLLAQIREQHGRLDLLVNNAGVAPRERRDLLEASEESFDHVLRVNLKGPYFLTQQAANWMLELMAAGTIEQPKIVFISSISSYTVSVARGEYCTAKAGLSMAVQLFAVRLAEHGIGVYEIQPGIIETDMTAGVREKYDKLIHEEGLLPIRRWGTPDDIGQAVVAIAQGAFPYSTGQVFHVDGGFHLRTL